VSKPGRREGGRGRRREGEGEGGRVKKEGEGRNSAHGGGPVWWWWFCLVLLGASIKVLFGVLSVHDHNDQYSRLFSMVILFSLLSLFSFSMFVHSLFPWTTSPPFPFPVPPSHQFAHRVFNRTVSYFLLFLFFVALFIDLLTDKVTPLSRWNARRTRCRSRRTATCCTC
jgi:hypothetical protein